MSYFLPDLLGDLAKVFASPRAFRGEAWSAAAQAPWTPPDLRRSLGCLAASDGEDMDVAYADQFLVSLGQLVLHLEASAHRSGWLRDPELLAELGLLYAALGFQVPEGQSPDHLAMELEALAVGLGRLASSREEDQGPLALALNALLDQHLRPFLESLDAVASGRPVHPAYAEALAAARSSVELARSGLQTFA